jgi:hypothetical protein
MALLDDAFTLSLLAASAFFVALSFGLLLRYRQVSQRITTSSDMGRDLWQALEQRMKKQDERILDMMGRLEVIQSRVLTIPAVREPTPSVPVPSPAPLDSALMEGSKGVTESGAVTQRAESQPESRAGSQGSRAAARPVELDETQLTAIRLLTESPRNTRQLTDALEKSREHTARIMKGLFEMGLVRRNDSTKPFVYQLTDEGRRHLPSN